MSALATLLQVISLFVCADVFAQVCTTQTFGNRDFNGISGSSDSNIIGVGKNGTIYREDGNGWAAMSSPTNEHLNDVEVVDAVTAFAVGDKGTVLQLVAGVWTDHTGFGKGKKGKKGKGKKGKGNEHLHGVWAASATEAYAVGKKGTIFSYDGANWTDESGPAGTNNTDLKDAWGDANAFYAMSDRGELYRYDRLTGSWGPRDNQCNFGGGFEDLWGDTLGNIYLVRRDEVYLHDGSSCSIVATASEEVDGIYGSISDGQIVAAGRRGVVLHNDGTGWTESTEGNEDIKDVWVSPTGNAYYAGKKGELTSCTNRSNVAFRVNHDNSGIHCLAETVRIDVVDGLTGSLRVDYSDQITLVTQTASGSWTLVSGGGTFVDALSDDGIATYTWPLGESSAEFALSYTQGPATVDIDVFQSNDPLISDDDSEGDIVFSASGFTLTAAALSNPPPALITPFTGTQIAGTDFGVFLAAFGQTPNDPVCGVIETYTGPQNLKFWLDHNDPASGTITTTINGSAISTTEASAVNQAVTFTNGQAAMTAKYKDAGRIQILVKDDSLVHPDLPTGIRGATIPFVVKPDHFDLSGIEDGVGNANPAAADASGAAFIAAGNPFSVTVTAYDAEGDVTPNYGQESASESVLLTSALVSPLAGNDPGLSPALAFNSFSAGSATGTTFTWPEVGTITLLPTVGDGDYLGGGDVTGTVSGNVGRFIPDHFTTALNAPEFQTQCGAGGFSYIGQYFDYSINPLITVTARATTNSVTQNYTGSFFKITNLSLLNRSYTAASGTLDLTGLPATSSDPVITDSGGGIGTMLFDSGTGISYLRSAAEAAFDADISLSIDVFDTDGVTTLSSPVSFSDIAFDNGANMRYGRLRFINALGSELVNLNVAMRAEYFVDAATGFVTNTDDSCTDNVNLSLSNFSAKLSVAETCVLDSGSPGDSGAGCAAVGPAGLRYREPPLGGNFNLYLLAPGAGNDGSTDVTADVPAWLEFDWDASVPGTQDPVGTATFGIYDGESKRIYTRELY